MKILVFSDSHGNPSNISKALKMHPDAELLIHLGDGINDLYKIKETYPDYEAVTVYGNFEDSFFVKKSENTFNCVTANGKKIFLCHGHRYSVGFSKQNLIYAALEQGADIALFGHTHVKHNEYLPPERLNTNTEKGLYLFNPGSISRPRDSIYASFGIIEIRDDGILLSHCIIK